jgi:ABC-type multidrug transport system ATPase subunit
MALVSVDHVSKLFGRFAALREVSVAFERGRLYAILGENGAGKSTLLRVIAGLARPTAGQIAWPEGKLPIGYMAHAAMLYDELSGMENLRYFASLYGIRSDDRLVAGLERVGLDPLLNRRVDAYSQGMRQRLSLARALFSDPDLLLLDEPFSNLDPASGAEIAKLLASLRDSGKTVLAVTHQVGYVDDIADELLMMSQGAIVSRRSGAAAISREVLEQ